MIRENTYREPIYKNGKIKYIAQVGPSIVTAVKRMRMEVLCVRTVRSNKDKAQQKWLCEQDVHTAVWMSSVALGNGKTTTTAIMNVMYVTSRV